VGGSFDDYVSLDRFVERFCGFRGNVFVIDPYPDDLQTMLSERLNSKAVLSVRACWNVLAHAFVDSLRTQGQGGRDSLNCMYDRLTYIDGCGIAYPIARNDADRL
jgi:hypothetical protein